MRHKHSARASQTWHENSRTACHSIRCQLRPSEKGLDATRLSGGTATDVVPSCKHCKLCHHFLWLERLREGGGGGRKASLCRPKETRVGSGILQRGLDKVALQQARSRYRGGRRSMPTPTCRPRQCVACSSCSSSSSNNGQSAGGGGGRGQARRACAGELRSDWELLHEVHAEDGPCKVNREGDGAMGRSRAKRSRM